VVAVNKDEIEEAVGEESGLRKGLRRGGGEEGGSIGDFRPVKLEVWGGIEADE